ncbi:molecular chaperone [Dyella sp. C9]|uniref:fimbrial biogenesis chaperone n=1 Tax=Dyella sp. C9 TaxID=2202154 RepID=UPI000DEF9F10|nr:molecular chaperone [Dyella sp. C9]
MRVFPKPLSAGAAVWSALLAFSTHASVVMTNTRVIYDGALREKAIQLTNQDDHPNLVQLWVDKGNAHSTVETADAPFVVTPQIFRMEAHAGQMVRLEFTGEDLPHDRESVFYLNFNQIPAIKSRDQNVNKLVLMFGNRLKLFYRPKGLPGSPDELLQRLSFTRKSNSASEHVQVDNPTPYHAVIRRASLEGGDKPCVLAAAVMIPPLSTAQWRVPADCMRRTDPVRLKLVLVNDFGGDTASDLPLH